MNYLRLLRVMTLKELRTTMRERQQLFGMAVGLTVMLVIIGVTGYRILGEARRQSSRPPSPTMTTTSASQPAPDRPRPSPAGRATDMLETISPAVQQHKAKAIRWAAILGGAAMGLFFSLGYLISATLASFVGEKEARTLETLLASPVPDTALFFAKCVSVLLPMAAIGYLFLLIGFVAALLFLHAFHVPAPAGIAFDVLLLSIPVLLLPQAAFVGLGAAISARAETMKGAGQVLSIVFFAIFFGGGYGLPLLLRLPALRDPLMSAARSFLDLPFVAQYFAGISLLALPAIVLLLVGRASFRRDSLL